MATLLELARTGQIYRLDPALEPREQEWRMVHTSPRLRNWIESELPELVATWSSQETPLQQLDALMDEFCSGCTLSFGQQFKPITHIRGGIWALKTPDLRIFGWFHVKDCFVGYRAEHADFVKTHNLYYGLAGEAADFRDQIDLNEPKFVPGDDPNAVVSNYSFA